MPAMRYLRIMIRQLLLLPLLGLLGLAACSTLSPPPPDPAQLAFACEIKKCECRPPHRSFTFTAAPPPKPIEWRSDGTASCPAGYDLSLVE